MTVLQGPLPTQLANAISDAVFTALEGGMAVDEAASVAVQVIADYARGAYGTAYLRHLAELMISVGDQPPRDQRS